MKVKEESENAGLKLNIQKTKTMVFASWQIDGEKMETVTPLLGGHWNGWLLKFSWAMNPLKKDYVQSLNKAVWGKKENHLDSLSKYFLDFLKIHL